MSKPLLKRTQSTFSDDPILVRGEQVRRDDDNIKTPSVTFYDIDYAIYSYLRNSINPRIVENNKVVSVPIIFSNGETWAQIQKHGYNRNIDGTVNRPLITIRRTASSDRSDLLNLDVNINPDGNYVISTRSKYSKNNRYDRFSITTNTTPTYEYYTTAVPEYITVSYEIIIWTDFTDQLNHIMEQIIPASGYAWGDTNSWKFITFVRDFSVDSSNAGTEQRIVRASSTLEVKGYILASHEYNVSNMKKSYSIKRVVFTTETVVGDAPLSNQVTNPNSSVNTVRDPRPRIRQYINSGKGLPGAGTSARN